MNILKLLAGPLIGSVIGYCTNYIAIKMLFRPRKAIMIGSFRVPFTPGIIPKEKKRIGKAIGEAVGSTLLTQQDIKDTLLNDEMKAYISSSIVEKLHSIAENEQTIKATALDYMSQENYEHYKERIEDIFTEKMVSAIEKIDFGEYISKEANRVVQEKIGGSMLEMFLDEKTVQSFTEPIGERVNQYVLDYGEEMIAPRIQMELEAMEDKSIHDMLEGQSLDEERMANAVEQIFEKAVSSYAVKLMEKINIAKIIEDKIEAMDVMELEGLILEVMDKELKAIVNLGAFIGFILGVLNIFI
ncbi:MAG: DUF445 domain-containing protein [Anaerostipes sp.]|jgi:uncharacterized membrane protein YheB (UPF0754 family)